MEGRSSGLSLTLTQAEIIKLLYELRNLELPYPIFGDSKDESKALSGLVDVLEEYE